MGDTRFRHGWAIGPYANFFARSDNILGQADATPDVTNGNLFFTNNTGLTTITNFDLTSTRGQSSAIHNEFEGKMITVMFLDDSTGLAVASTAAGNLVLSTSSDLIGANNVVSLIYHNSSWVELYRSSNRSDTIIVNSSGRGGGINLGGAGIFNADGVRVVISSGQDASTNNLIRAASGGREGQIITIINHGSATELVVNSAAAADTFITASSAQGAANTLVLEGSGGLSFVKVGDRWRELRMATAISNIVL